MNHTSIIIITKPNQTIIDQQKKGIFITHQTEIEHGIIKLIERPFDIVIIDFAMDSESKARIRAIANYIDNETILLENNSDDIHYTQTIAKAIQHKMVRKFAHIQIQEKN